MTSFTWTGQGKTGAWSDAGNWSAGGPPGAADLALFDTGINSTVTGDATVGGIDFVGAQTVDFAGAIMAHGLAGLPYAVTVGLNAQIEFGSGASLAAPSLEVGVGGGSSTLTMAGAALTTTRAVIGGDRISQGVVSIDHALWSDAKSLVIGGTGFGALSMGPGADVFVGVGGKHATPGNVVLGAHRGAQGSLDLNRRCDWGGVARGGAGECGAEFGAGRAEWHDFRERGQHGGAGDRVFQCGLVERGAGRADRGFGANYRDKLVAE
jgi:hypothetical protein